MTREGKRENYLYVELSELDAKLLEMPYTDSKVSMYVMLPNAVDGKNIFLTARFNIFKNISYAQGKKYCYRPKQ